MSSATIEAARPASSGEFILADPSHFEIVELRHRQVAQLLKSRQCDALLLQSPANFSWFTAGGCNQRLPAAELTAALFVTADSRVLVTSSVDSGQIFEREIPGLGFQTKERFWHASRDVLIQDLCRGRRVLSDCGFPGTTEASSAIDALRAILHPAEGERMRDLGRALTHAVEATARHVEPGQSEAEIAGELAHRLFRHEINPVRIQVMADGRGQSHRHWSFTGSTMKTWCVIGATGRRAGLHVSANRTVCFGHPPEQVASAHRQAAMVQATGSYFSRAGIELGGLSDRVQRIYEKFVHVEEWQRSDQGELFGYHPCESPIVPRSPICLADGMAICWHCSVGPALLGDSWLIADGRASRLTPAEQWPLIRVEVKGRLIKVPDILCRETGMVL